MNERLLAKAEQPDIAYEALSGIALDTSTHDKPWETRYAEQEEAIGKNNEAKVSPEIEQLFQESIVGRTETIMSDLAGKGLVKEAPGDHKGTGAATAKVDLSEGLSGFLAQLGYKDAKQAFIWRSEFRAVEGRGLGRIRSVTYNVMLSNGEERFDSRPFYGYGTGSDEFASITRELTDHRAQDPSFHTEGRSDVVIHPNRQYVDTAHLSPDYMHAGSTYSVALDLILDSIQSQEAREDAHFPDRFNR